MKVLRLRFKNLNSLLGEWDIDFTHPDYVSSGIFAITGPTGAGKTTILDAVCLALYGQTPRLSRISQSENETMSRQTGECFAEVVFETGKGRFRCHWSQHRSRRQAGGQLQAPRHEIAEAGEEEQGGRVLESRLKAVAVRVEEVTGMDFDRFTRSMLLAQGGFAAFLQARPDERAPILEQITGTEIYSRISMKVHERTVDERKKLAVLRAELGGITLLTPEQEGALQTEILAGQEKVASLVARLDTVRRAQSWREQVAALAAELLRLDQDWASFLARKEAAAPDLERLAEAGRASILAGEYAGLCALRGQQQEETIGLRRAGERIVVVEQDSQAALAALEQAEAHLNRTGEEQGREMELIRKTRELDVQLGEAVSRLQALGAQIAHQQEQDDGYRQSISAGEGRTREIEAELREVADFLAERRVDGELVKTLTGIEQRFKALQEVDRRGRENEKRLKRQGAAVEAARIACQQVSAVCEAARSAQLRAEQQWQEKAAACATLLQGRDFAAWRAESEGLAARENRLLTLEEVLSRREEARNRLAELRILLESLETRRQLLTTEENGLIAALSQREEIARQVEEKVVLLNRIRDLEAERAHLVDGAPCPLCGAVDHPYAIGNIPRLDEGQRELQQARAGVEDGRQKLDAVKKEIIGAVKDREQAAREQVDLRGRLERDTFLGAEVFAELGLSAEPESWLELARTESEHCRERLAGLRAVLVEAEQREQEERKAQAVALQRKEEFDRQDKARLQADLDWKTASREMDRLREEATDLHRVLEQTRDEVRGEIAPYGCMDVVPDQARTVLESLQARSDAYTQGLQAQERLHRGLVDCGGEREKQQALLAEVQKNLAGNLALLRQRAVSRDALADQRQVLYGAKNPDAEEKRLALELRQAGTERDAALREQHRLQVELSGLRQQIQALAASVDIRGGQLAEWEPAFARRLIELGFADEAAFLRAQLPPADVEALRRQEDRLRREETELITRRRDRQADLAAQQEKNLTDQPLDRIREENNVLTARLTALQQGLGALQQRIHHHREQQRRSQSRLEEIARQQQECARWERLHQLIGSSDGKKFRNFAQGLTFELMVAHANRQLRKMSDRYILIRDDAEPLELNVIDNYQAGEIRSTKNLSGGESFLVSLALSLGLSGMASRSVRVDSLFLDEGFGTLDEDALETALETLSGLQRDGKLIGIISHVPALKERIGAQIQVEAVMAGRSRLHGPGCRRIS